MGHSETLVDEIRGKAFLIELDEDTEGRRESVRQMLKVTVEQRRAGVSEFELRALFEESMWNDLRKLEVDPGSLKAETIIAVGTRMIDACMEATRPRSILA